MALDIATDERAAYRNPWLGVELRHLAALAAVAREESFRGAADSLGYVQSAVSQQIAYLERVVGVRLVERSRGHRHVSLTQAGALLVERGHEILAHLEAARADLAALSGESRSLRVGVVRSIAPSLVPKLVVLFKPRFPRVDLRWREIDFEAELPPLIEHGALDVAFGELPPSSGPLESYELFSDPYVLLVRDEANESDAEIRSRIYEEPLPLIGPVHPEASARIEAQLQARGIDFRYVFSSESVTTVQALVAAGLGVAIVPRFCLGLPSAGIKPISLDGILLQRSFGMYWQRERQHTQMIEGLRQVAVEGLAVDQTCDSTVAALGRR
jgi:DNA-binding transcriptional LysR family regulator